MGKRTAEHQRAPAVDELGQLLRAEHEPAARTAQCLVGRGGDDVRVRDGVVVAGQDLAGDQPREMRHVDHERGADLICDLSQHPEVHEPGV